MRVWYRSHVAGGSRSLIGGPADGVVKIEKGGWRGGNQFVARFADRHFEDRPGYSDVHIGFRVVSPC